MSESEQLRQATAALAHSAQADGVIERSTAIWLVDESSKAADEISRLRAENQIRAQEYAALLGLWKETSERAEKAETVIAAVKALQFSPYPAHGSGWVEIVCEPEPGRFQRALAQYDAEQRETT